ncbi:hypothetical protein NL676_035304 [Syzygium grande]|nr:hypothetical protein NL676_035304 [Syzygium grande]
MERDAGGGGGGWSGLSALSSCRDLGRAVMPTRVGRFARFAVVGMFGGRPVDTWESRSGSKWARITVAHTVGTYRRTRGAPPAYNTSKNNAAQLTCEPWPNPRVTTTPPPWQSRSSAAGAGQRFLGMLKPHVKAKEEENNSKSQHGIGLARQNLPA